jgi:serralysin
VLERKNIPDQTMEFITTFAHTFEGNARNNIIRGTDLADKIEGLGGADTLYGRGGADKLEGGSGNDWLSGGNGNDKLDGGAGADKLFGGAGGDKIESGTGNDQMFGGSGRDAFAFYHGNDQDSVKDFADNSDRIDLTSFNFANVNAAKSFASQSNSDVVFNFGSGDTLTIENITLSNLTSVDFIL